MLTGYFYWQTDSIFAALNIASGVLAFCIFLYFGVFAYASKLGLGETPKVVTDKDRKNARNTLINFAALTVVMLGGLIPFILYALFWLGILLYQFYEQVLLPLIKLARNK